MNCWWWAIKILFNAFTHSPLPDSWISLLYQLRPFSVKQILGSKGITESLFLQIYNLFLQSVQFSFQILDFGNCRCAETKSKETEDKS